jgi:hypothetical protein
LAKKFNKPKERRIPLKNERTLLSPDKSRSFHHNYTTAMTTTTIPGRNDITSTEICWLTSTKKQRPNAFTDLHQAAKRDIKLNNAGYTEILQNHLTTCDILLNDMKSGILTWHHVKPHLPDPWRCSRASPLFESPCYLFAFPLSEVGLPVCCFRITF